MQITEGKFTCKREGNRRRNEKGLHIYLDKRASLRWTDGVLLFSVGLAVRVTMIHVLAVGARVREALEALGALEGLFAAVQSLMFS